MDYCIRKKHATKSVNKYVGYIADCLSFRQMDKITLMG